MVRRLPWAVDSDTKKSTKRGSSNVSSPALPTKRNKRDPSPSSVLDLVDSDLNPTIPSTPKRLKALQNPNSSPPSSPPPAPPPVSYMREGFAADDQWMMVEDEFLATAKLYTQHLHQQAYAEAKRRAAARGQDTLRGLSRPRDGRTEQSFQTKLKREAKGNREKLAAGEEESDVESDNEWLDPQLAVLMNARQETLMLGREGRRLGKARSETRAAKGFLRSPAKARKFTNGDECGLTSQSAANGRHDEHTDESDDSDDLDGPARPKPASKPAKPTTEYVSKASSIGKPAKPTEAAHKSTGLFKKFAAASPPAKDIERPSKSLNNGASNRDQHASDKEHASKSAGLSTTDDFGSIGKSTGKDELAEWVAKKKAAKEKAAQGAKRHQKDWSSGKSSSSKPKKTDYGDVPTFLI